MIWILLVLILATSCKRKKRDDGDIRERSVRYLEKKVAQNTNAPEWLSCKARIKYEAPDDKQTVVAIIKMQKDSLIWASISVPVGVKVEVARALITPDSVKVLDKWNKLYYAEDFSYLQQYINYPLDFATLQHLLWGTPPYEQSYKNVEIKNGEYHLSAPDAGLSLRPENYEIAALVLKDIFTGRIFEAQFDNYEDKGGSNFSMKRKYELKTPESYNFDINFSKVKVNEPFSISWRVSDKYERVD